MGEGVFDSGVDAGGFRWIGLLESGEAFAQACPVFVGDGEDSDAALGAAWVADEVMATALVGVGYGCVYDLDKCFDLSPLGDDTILAEAGEEVEEAVVGGLVVEEAKFAALAHVGDDFDGTA